MKKYVIIQKNFERIFLICNILWNFSNIKGSKLQVNILKLNKIDKIKIPSIKLIKNFKYSIILKNKGIGKMKWFFMCLLLHL